MRICCKQGFTVKAQNVEFFLLHKMKAMYMGQSLNKIRWIESYIKKLLEVERA